MQRYILVLDEGTTGTKAFVVDENAKIVSSGYREISLITNELGYAELNGEEIFEKSVAACKEAMEKAGIEAKVYDSNIKNIVNDVVHTYTKEEIKAEPERAEKEILEKLQGFFDSNVVVDVGFVQVTSE